MSTAAAAAAAMATIPKKTHLIIMCVRNYCPSLFSLPSLLPPSPSPSPSSAPSKYSRGNFSHGKNAIARINILRFNSIWRCCCDCCCCHRLAHNYNNNNNQINIHTEHPGLSHIQQKGTQTRTRMECVASAVLLSVGHHSRGFSSSIYRCRRRCCCGRLSTREGQHRNCRHVCVTSTAHNRSYIIESWIIFETRGLLIGHRTHFLRPIVRPLPHSHPFRLF